MTCIEAHGRCLAYIFWAFILAGIIADFFCQFDELEFGIISRIPVSLIFMAMSSGAPLFRVFGTHIVVKIVHFILSLLPLVLICLTYKNIGLVTAITLLVVGGLQFGSACLLFCCRPARSPLNYAWRAGLHALFGIVSIVIYYIICCFLLKPDINRGSAVVEVFYLLLLLMMLLTPPCQSPDQAIPRVEHERKELIRKLRHEEKLQSLKRQSISQT